MSTAPASPSCRSEAPTGRAVPGTWALASGTVMQPLNSSMVAVALVPIALSFDDDSALPWVVSGLYIATAVCAPTAGRLADIFGPRRLYLIGLAVVAFAAALGPFAPTTEWLIASRVVIGMGTAVHFPAAMAIVRVLAQQGYRHTGALGTISMCGQVMAAAGPTVGGFLVAAFGWPAIFWANIPLAAVAWVLVVRRVPELPPPPREPGLRSVLRAVDPLGVLLFVASLVGFMSWLLSLEGTPRHSALAVAAVAGALFLLQERRAAEPFFDVAAVLRNRPLALTYLRVAVTFTAFYCVFYGLPQWLQGAAGYGTATTGLLILPIFATGALTAVGATWLARVVSPRALLVIGSAAFALGGAALAFGVTQQTPVWLLVGVAVLLGVPNGFNNLGNQLTLHDSVDPAASGVASGMYRTAQYVGASLSAVVVAHALGETSQSGGIGELGGVVLAANAVLLAATAIGLLRARHRSKGLGVA